ncbi:tellurium resistance protein [Gammaproteobacteria bacterium]|nr:tellurium resistance protein [Gammaproteobacteria bacterium]
MKQDIIIDKTQEISPEKTSKIQQIVSEFNAQDSLDVLNFGKPALESISAFSDGVLSKIRKRDVSGASDTLDAMIKHMKHSKIDTVKPNTFMAKLPIVGELFNSFGQFVKSFDTIKDQLDNLENNLRAHEHQLEIDIKQLDQLYHENLNMLGELDIYIEAGTQINTQMLEMDLPILYAHTKKTDDPIDHQNLRDAQQMQLRLEKRISNLKTTRLAAIQTAPQIRLSQEGDRMLAEDISDICHNAIPLWKRQFLIAISNYEKEKALKVTKTVKDYTNEQYVKNAEKLQILEQQIAQNYQRGVLDIESLKRVNDITIDTLNNTLKHYEEGRKLRAQAQQAIEKCEDDLKIALSQTLT